MLITSRPESVGKFVYDPLFQSDGKLAVMFLLCQRLKRYRLASEVFLEEGDIEVLCGLAVVGILTGDSALIYYEH